MDGDVPEYFLLETTMLLDQKNDIIRLFREGATISVITAKYGGDVHHLAVEELLRDSLNGKTAPPDCI